jgi:hypothetical protein
MEVDPRFSQITSTNFLYVNTICHDENQSGQSQITGATNLDPLLSPVHALVLPCSMIQVITCSERYQDCICLHKNHNKIVCSKTTNGKESLLVVHATRYQTDNSHGLVSLKEAVHQSCHMFGTSGTSVVRISRSSQRQHCNPAQYSMYHDVTDNFRSPLMISQKTASGSIVCIRNQVQWCTLPPVFGT